MLKQAYVTYCDEAKHTVLGVKRNAGKILCCEQPDCMYEMAEGGGAKAAGADVCVSIYRRSGTGYRGMENPVGCVFIGCFYNGNVTVKEYSF